MNDRILIPLPRLGTLELSRKVLEQNLVKWLVTAESKPASELIGPMNSSAVPAYRKLVDGAGARANRVGFEPTNSHEGVNGIPSMNIRSVDSVDVVYVDERTASKITGFSPITFQQWRSRGTGGPPYYKPNGKKVLYKLDELIDWVQQTRCVPAATQLAEDRP
jgi:hypothetical protein